MRRVITATLLAGALAIPIVGGAAEPAFAICFGVDGEEKVDNLPYQGLGTFNVDGAGQTDNAPTPVGATVRMKGRFTRIGGSEETADVKVKAVDPVSTPGFRVRYFAKGDNITAAMENNGTKFKNMELGERTKVLTVEVKVKPGPDGAERHIFLDGQLKGTSSGCAPDRVGVIVSRD
jgi:hypothetical protein